MQDRNNYMERYIDFVHKHELKTYGIVVLQEGNVLFKHFLEKEIRRDLYSGTKSITSSAVGIALHDGYISLDDSLWKYIKDMIPNDITTQHQKALEKVTIKRLLTMSVKDFTFGFEEDNWLKYALSIPLPNIDVYVFEYSNIPSFLVGVILEKAIGISLIDYLNERLFSPMGIYDVKCLLSPEGFYYGSSGIELTISELCAVGQLYLQDGIYNGKRILQSEWVKAATSKQINTREGGYGYFFWMQEEGSYRISGMGGQVCMILPKRNMVIAAMSDLTDGNQTQALRKFLWDTFYEEI